MAEEQHSDQESAGSQSILDTIMGSQTQTSLGNFEPSALVSGLLGQLKQRDREILTKRFGLEGAAIETLELIGKQYGLTRERIRQIEKDSLTFLKRRKLPELEQALQLILDTIAEHGGIMSEELLLETMLLNKSQDRNYEALKFLLHLGDQFTYQKETQELRPSWSVMGFNPQALKLQVEDFKRTLEKLGKAVAEEELHALLLKSSAGLSVELNERILKSYLNLSKSIQINPFGEIGLRNWAEVTPRDVGDKAFLVLKHHGKPEHYSNITKLINEHKFDRRTAYQETVHNELIKDPRFVLIGRGVYALSEWGYKKGVVADVITEIIKAAGGPLNREEIIERVLKQRQVKRNTILVGLSNKKLFKKADGNKYMLVS